MGRPQGRQTSRWPRREDDLLAGSADEDLRCFTWNSLGRRTAWLRLFIKTFCGPMHRFPLAVGWHIHKYIPSGRARPLGLPAYEALAGVAGVSADFGGWSSRAGDSGDEERCFAQGSHAIPPPGKMEDAPCPPPRPSHAKTVLSAPSPEPKPASRPASTQQDDDVVGKAYDSRLMRRLITYLFPYKWGVASRLSSPSWLKAGADSWGRI